jgi:peptidyl-prolyl cis-trans isomerase SurA
MRSSATALFALLALAPPVLAQGTAQGPEHLGRVAAVVGDSMITDFELTERMIAWAAERQRELPVGTDREALARQLLEDRINELLLVQAAARDTSIHVNEDQVERAVESVLNQYRRQYGGEAGLEQLLRQQNRTLVSFRESLLQNNRRQTLITMFLQKARAGRKPPPVTDEEVRAVFEAADSSQVPMLPATITFEQVVVPVKPSDSVLAAARALADSIVIRIRDGEDFAALARRYSADPGSRELGGDLGYFRRGVMFREFEEVAFSPFLRPGDVSPPVLTPLGYHIIKLERIRTSERQARHILIKADPSEADVERARAEAEGLVERIRAGASVGELARQYDQDEQLRVGPWPRDSLPQPYDQALAEVTAGQVVGPIRLETGGGLLKWAVVRVIRLETSRRASLEDTREQIRQNLAQQKLIDELIGEIRRRTYIEVRLAGSPPDD